MAHFQVQLQCLKVNENHRVDSNNDSCISHRMIEAISLFPAVAILWVLKSKWFPLTMLRQHTLQMFADHCGPRQTIPWETINQGLLQPQGELYSSQPIFDHRSWDQLLKFRTSFYNRVLSFCNVTRPSRSAPCNYSVTHHGGNLSNKDFSRRLVGTLT